MLTRNSSRFLGLSTEERKLVSALAAAELPLVTATDVIAVRRVSKVAANQILTRLHRKGWLQRIRRGVYAVVPLSASRPDTAIADVWPVAMRLFSPCFISGWSAAEHWDLTEQIFNSVSVVTSRPQRRAEQTFGGISFRTRQLPETRFFGQTLVWLGSQQAQVADPHRLVIDVLDDPSFGGGARQAIDIVRAYWSSKHADANRVLEYARRFGRGTVFKRLGFTAERFGSVDADWKGSCAAAMSAGLSNLDPAGPQRGKIDRAWRLRINMPVDE